MVERRFKKLLKGSAVVILLSFGILFFSQLSADAATPVPAEKTAFGITVQPTDIDPASLKPGLAAYYKFGFWRHIEKMPDQKKFLEQDEPRKPIPYIDHRFGKENVFDSGRNRGVGVQMMGFIHLPEAGEWQFKVQSNDGIEVTIQNILVVSDPEWHSDRFSEPLGFYARDKGWYSILLRYFQRKGTATLEFYWKKPGEQDFTIIPKEAYWHRP